MSAWSVGARRDVAQVGDNADNFVPDVASTGF
jgi:hypothetical protein